LSPEGSAFTPVKPQRSSTKGSKPEKPKKPKNNNIITPFHGDLSPVSDLPPRPYTTDHHLPDGNLKIYRAMSEREKDKTLKTHQIQPPKKGTNKHKYVSTKDPSHALQYKKKGSEHILEITVKKTPSVENFTSTLVHQSIQKEFPKNSQFHYEKFPNSRKTSDPFCIGIQRHDLEKVNKAITSVQIYRPRTCPPDLKKKGEVVNI